MASGGSNTIIDTLRLNEEQWRELAAKLDSVDPATVGKRRHARISYRKLAQIAVAIKPPEGDWGKYIVRSRDLSPGGIGFIHGAYLHAGSKCRVILKDCQGQVVCLEGEVKRCELIQGTAHDIGVAFDQEIDVNQFMAD